SALAHAPPTPRAISTGAFMLVDWGAHNGLYRSDLTRILRPRTEWFHPKNKGFDEGRLETVYKAVLTAQQRAIAAIRPGIKGSDIDAVARGVLADAGLIDYFTHGLGHGLGLEVHEAPSVRPKVEDTLEAGKVITIEPGVYFPGWGGV